MRLRYKSIPGLILNKALMSELANHCAYCHSAIAARSIRRHYTDAHPQLLQYEPLHRAQVYGLAQLGSGKGQCMLCEQTCNNVQRHQCGVLFQLSVLLGQTYDVSHFPVMPIMLRALPADLPDEDRPSSRPAMSTEPQDERPSEIPSAVHKPSAQSSKPEPSGLSSLHKCTHCHMAFLSATGLHQHMQECHDPTVLDPDHAPPAQVHKKWKTSRTIQQMLGLPSSGPIPEAPRQFECPLCLETVGRKALIGHLRRAHQATHIRAFPFVPDQDMLPGSLTCRHCYSTFTMEQALITHFKRGSCPVLTCQWAKAQHFGTMTMSVQVPMKPGVDHTLPALLHRYFDLSQAGREFDPELCPTLDLVTWFRYTTDWLSHFPEMPHTSFVTDQAFAMVRALGHHPPIAWAWTLDTDCIPKQQWHEAPIHDHTF